MRSAEWMSGKYGIAVHYLPQINSKEGKKKLSPNEMADGFDVRVFADKVQEMGASWVIFPFGQNTGFYWSENPIIEKILPGRCSKRDLMVELADELVSRNIRLIGYIPTEMDFQPKEMQHAFKWDIPGNKKEFMEIFVPFVRYYAEKLGKRLSGWWFDGNYNSWEKSFTITKDWSNERFDKEEWFSAVKAGNPDAVIAMCTGANLMEYVFEDEEYLPGEANDLTNIPWKYDSREKQWHVFTWLDCFWGLSSEERMPEPRFTNKQLYEYVKKCTDKKGAVTLNIGIYEDGTLAEKTVRQVKGLKTIVGNDLYTLFTNKYNDGLRKLELHMAAMKNCVPFEVNACGDGNYYNGNKGSDIYNMYNWMTSFVTGLAPIYFQSTKNENYLKWANSFEKYYHAKVFEMPMDSMHDIGFLYSPYSVAMYKLTGFEAHREDALKAADELAKRFDINGKYIDAWNRMDDDERVGRAIIDCMMNISLLLWAWKETGHTFYRDIAVAHAQTTRKLFIREDYSVAHSYLFDRKNGKALREDNNCGYENGSWWARGTAWAIYGFAILARYLDSDKYRELAKNLASAYINELPKGEYVPVWDFRLPENMPAKKCGSAPPEWDESKKEYCEFNVDTSAAAIVSCGLLCLYEQTNEKWMFDFVIKSMEELSNNYVHWESDVPGLIHHQNGNMTYTSFGDYFFIEALGKILYGTEICW